MLGCIRQELLSGAQPDTRFQQVRDYLRFFPNLPVDEEDNENAAACYYVCRRKGIQGGPSIF
jgi:predicted nucleic acid-binding protein